MHIFNTLKKGLLKTNFHANKAGKAGSSKCHFDNLVSYLLGDLISGYNVKAEEKNKTQKGKQRFVKISKGELCSRSKMKFNS